MIKKKLRREEEWEDENEEDEEYVIKRKQPASFEYTLDVGEPKRLTRTQICMACGRIMKKGGKARMADVRDRVRFFCDMKCANRFEREGM